MKAMFFLIKNSIIKVCAELKTQFYLSKPSNRLKGLSIDFKEPLPSTSRNVHMLKIVDEYLRFCFCYPYPNMNTQTAIKCLDNLFVLFGALSFVHSDNAEVLVSRELKD